MSVAAFQVGKREMTGFLRSTSVHTLYFPGGFIGGNTLDLFQRCCLSVLQIK
jgi:hypothetical protein